MKAIGINRCIVVCAALFISFQLSAQTQNLRHEVQGGETLYSISRTYGVSVEAIRQANPKMGDTLLAGSVINIPQKDATPTQPSTPVTTQPVTPVKAQPVTPVNAQPVSTSQPEKQIIPSTAPECKFMYKVEKKETVYSISHRFGLTEEELCRANPQIDEKKKVKKGEYLCIPYSQAEIAQLQLNAQKAREEAERLAEQERQRELEAERARRRAEVVDVAVFLPFELSAKKKSASAVKIYDFYEGFLLGVKEMKNNGISVNVHTYEEKASNAVMDSLLRLPEMTEMELMIGPSNANNISSVSRFCKQNNICQIIPFSTKENLVNNYPTSFQVNVQVAGLYNSVYEQFIQQYQNHDIFFVSCQDKEENESYTNGFKRALQDAGISFKTTSMDKLSKLEELMEEKGRPTVFIISTGAVKSFDTLTQNIEKNEGYAFYNYTLFGPMGWANFNQQKNQQKLTRHHAAFFTTYYAYPYSTPVSTFKSQFHRYFKREALNANPNFDMLGYDIARYFIKGYAENRSDFYDVQSNMGSDTLQNPMQFVRKADGSGFINAHVKIIHF